MQNVNILEQAQGFISGYPVIVRSFKRNFGIYSELGGELVIKGRRKALELAHAEVELTNYYFGRSQLDGASPLLLVKRDSTLSEGTPRTRLLESAFAFNLEVPKEGIVLPKAGPIFPQGTGVVTRADVRIGTRRAIMISARGDYPLDFLPPLMDTTVQHMSVARKDHGPLSANA